MDVTLADVDEMRLAELVGAARTEAAADEVTPPVTKGGGWTDERTAWFRAYHRDRRVGLGRPAGEATWAVVLSGAVVGAARLRWTADPGVADTGLWLTRSARGAGVGWAALLAVLELAAAAGVREVHADTTAANTAALTVLRHLGFAVAEPDDDGRVRAVVAPGSASPRD